MKRTVVCAAVCEPVGEGASAWARRSFGLPDDVADRALIRLTWMAAIVGIMTAFDVFAHIVFRRHAPPEMLDYMAMPPMALYMRLLAVLDAAFVFWIIRRTNIARQLKLDIGLIFEVAGAAVLALTYLSFTTVLNSPWQMGVVSPVVIWILVWRMIVPTSSVRAAITSVASAAMVPLAFVIMDHQGVGVVDGLNSVAHTYITFGAALIAWLSSRVVYKMGTAVTEARQLGAYQLEKLIGKGGMGEVWRASHRMLKRPAAIKLIRPEMLGPHSTSEHNATLKRFEQEAQATANLESTHTVQLYDFGSTDDGAFYYVMELLNGVDLESLVERYGPVSPERVVHLLKQVCHSLSEAHGIGMTHRDIKPANIFVCKLGPDYDFVKVLDFGLVKLAEDRVEDVKLTAEGLTTGTPAYMAPELALGGDKVGPATDLYMLGCVAYWLLTGQLVFPAETPIGVVSAHIKDTPVPVSKRSELEVPAELEALIMQCLEKDPAARPASAAELRRQLAAIEVREGWTSDRARTWWIKHNPSLAPAT